MNPQSVERAAPLLARGSTQDALAARVATITVVVPLACVLLGSWQLISGRVTAVELGLLASLYALTLIGVEVGFHRTFAHRGLSAKPALRAVLAVLGSMTAQGPVLWWVALHRAHHERSDRAGDLHSPHVVDGEPVARLRGFWHAHLGWMWRGAAQVDWSRYAPDIARDPLLYAVHRRYAACVALGIALPALVGWLSLGGLQGAARGALWGGLVRMCLVHHAMWSVASVCHLFGSQPYRVDGADHSRNNAWLALPTFGQSWHNNHHAFPSSARHGLEWWQLDINYVVIRVLGWLGLVSDVRVPSVTARRARLQRKVSDAP